MMEPITPILLASDAKRLLLTRNIQTFKIMVDYYRAALKNKFTGRIDVAGHKLFYHDLKRALFMVRETMLIKYYGVPLSDRSPVIYDIGSNIGVTMLYFKTVYPGAKVYCFEPQEKAYYLLTRNIVENQLSDTYAYNVAVTNHNGTVLFEDDAEGTGLLAHMSTTGRPVACCRLSDMISGPVDLLKMDAEGAEANILNDLVESGKIRHVKNIVMEYHYNSLSRDRLEWIARVGGYQLSIDSYGLCECRAILKQFS